MSDNRIVIEGGLADVQAWTAEPGRPCMVIYWNSGHRKGGGWTGTSLYLSPVEARAIADALLKGADHADKVRAGNQAEAA